MILKVVFKFLPNTDTFNIFTFFSIGWIRLEKGYDNNCVLRDHLDIDEVNCESLYIKEVKKKVSTLKGNKRQVNKSIRYLGFFPRTFLISGKAGIKNHIPGIPTQFYFLNSPMKHIFFSS